MAKEATPTKVPRNPNLAKLQTDFFQGVRSLHIAHVETYPDAKVISLGIGDTTEPIPVPITSAMEAKARALSTHDGYTGYGDKRGEKSLRSAIAKNLYSGLNIKETEVFISDGAKCNIARLEQLFGPAVSIAVQDPSYPGYVENSVLVGQTGGFLTDVQHYDKIGYMKCTPENDFFPDLSSVERKDVIYFCSPNNPTGAAATRLQLEQLVAHAKQNGSIIVYDSAYAVFVTDDNPKSIFEIAGAREVAIEVSSFSKYAGFTGVRLGWTVVPDGLLFSDGSPVINDFYRVMCTCFNSASNIAQAGGLACLSTEGRKAVNEVVAFYKENAQILMDTFMSLGFKTFGGKNAPFVWVQFPGRKSWDVFAEILEGAHIVTTPGSGFGPAGEGFIRASAFGSRENIVEACKRLRALYQH
ncbi:hypothetical protein L7F22_036928 [Adiantum nelumboides]|nr:hypothetical protein [Adiantum nelumboides]